MKSGNNKKSAFDFKTLWAGVALVAGLATGASSALAQPVFEPDAFPAIIPDEMASYADLVALADQSELVIRAEIRRQIRVEAERAIGVKPGYVRLYIQARTLAVVAGQRGLGESFDYVVDVPLDSKGKVPKLKKREVLLFAKRVPGRPATVQLITNTSQFAYAPALESRLRPILTGLIDSDAPPIVTGIADALAVKGTLVGESETQVFLNTTSGAPVSLTILRRPNQSPSWGVSWGEIVDASAQAPARDTLRWYRLACALPQTLPSSANLSRNAEERRLAQQDYRLVIEQLGPCDRRITGDS